MGGHMKIGFTGTRQGMSKHQKEALKVILIKNRMPHIVNEFHHGDCVGSDVEAHEIAFDIGFWIVVHPPDNAAARAFQIGHCEKKPRPYLVRDHDIVDDCDILVAAPAHNKEVLRSGTWATIRYARKEGKPVFLLERGI
jgi:hypothetical protein